MKESLSGEKEAFILWETGASLRFYMSRSYWSLMAIAAWAAAIVKDRPPRVWVPAYFCNESLGGLRQVSGCPVFYPITESLNPDWKACDQLANDLPPDLFLIVHYFGIPADIDGARRFCHQHSSILVEDCAHVLLPTQDMGKNGDFVLFSPHKLLTLPDGAVLFVHDRFIRKIGETPETFCKTFSEVIKLLPQDARSVGPWVSKQIIKMVIPQVAMNAYRRRSPVRHEGGSFGKISMSARQTWLSRRLLTGWHESHLEAYAWLRWQNTILLERYLRGKENVALVRPQWGKGIPYMLGLRFPDPAEADQFKANFFKAGCVVLSWPDLSPEVLADPALYSTAIALRRRTVFFPLHQQIHVKKALRTLASEDRRPTIKGHTEMRVEWDVPVTEWDALYRRMPRSPLTQSVAYVTALERARKWHGRFATIEQNGIKMGIFAVLEKRFPLNFVIARLNRGPVWLSQDVPIEAQFEALRVLSLHYRFLDGRILFIAPNIPLSAAALQSAYFAGFRRRLVRPWASIWVDLRKDEGDLRKKLNGKWRNQLVNAEKRGLDIDVSENRDTFGWMLTRHAAAMQDKGFEDPPISMVRELRFTVDGKGEHFLVFRALLSHEPVGSISIVTHGTSATYLLGWNGSAGRKTNANNYLLWNAMLYLKHHGFDWFELGGINEWGTPGITSFKRGIGGEDYRLVGEYTNLRCLS